MIDAFPYVMAVLGFLAVYVLNDIKSSIKEIKLTMKSLEKDLRGGLTTLERRQEDHDKRLALVEQRCNFNHPTVP